LAKFKVPREIVFREELPRNAIGKVVKRYLFDN
jgi:acyl-coenzyme A synthetase/AMP-(fatty) acid ligase